MDSVESGKGNDAFSGTPRESRQISQALTGKVPRHIRKNESVSADTVGSMKTQFLYWPLWYRVRVLHLRTTAVGAG